MRISIKTGSYNEKRYGIPYIAEISEQDGTVKQWGKWIGQKGQEGLSEIDVDAPCILMHGQKDYRGNNGAPDYCVLLPSGSKEYMSKAEAVIKLRLLKQG